MIFLLNALACSLFLTIRSTLRNFRRFLLAIVLACSALTIPTFLGALFWSVHSALPGLTTNTEISVFMERSAPEAAARAIETQLAKAPAVDSVRVMPRAKALESVNAGLGIQPRPGAANPLPDIVIVTVKSESSETEIASLAAQCQKFDRVESVAYDAEWASAMTALTRPLHALGILLTLSVFLLLSLVIYTTIRLTTQAERDENRVLYFLGSSHMFIRLPYIWRGGFTLLLASLLALTVTKYELLFLSQPLQAFARHFGVSLSPALPPVSVCVAIVLLLGVLGGVIGAFAPNLSSEQN